MLCKEETLEGRGEGWITAVTYSPEYGHWIGLGFINSGYSFWQNEKLIAADPVRNKHVRIHVVSPHMVDPKGERMHG